jgi:hypothetical protein
LAVLLGQGLAAWLASGARGSPVAPAPPLPAVTPLVAPALHAEVAMVLAGMALGGRREGRC